MIYRNIGKTGMKAGIVGLGAEHLEAKDYPLVEETINAAYENEMNVMDVFMPGEAVRKNIAKALGSRRKEFLIQGHIGSVVQNGQAGRSRDVEICKKYAEDFLRHFNYMDMGMMFYIDTDEDYKQCFETKYIDYVLKLKKDGDIRSIGFSSHNTAVASKVIESGIIDVMMFSINPAYDMIPPNYELDNMFTDKHKELNFDGINPSRSQLYALCKEKDVSITVMKTLGSGRLLSKELSPLSVALTVGQCIHYALTRPAVVSTLIGCLGKKQVEEACKYLTMDDAEKDYSIIAKNFKGSFLGKCVYCNHCLPCPSNINIAEVTRALDAARLNTANIPTSIQSDYAALTVKASACVECGSCEKNCPFGVKVTDNMKLAAEIFGDC